jgi:beta-glucanase (GH16 family)
MLFYSFSKFKKKLVGHNYDERQITFIISLTVIVFFIWGSYNNNLSRFFDTLNYPNQIHASHRTLPFQVGSDLLRKPTKKIKHSVKPALPIGPIQNSSLFSEYPSWAQNFVDYKSQSLISRYWNINQGPADNSNYEAQYYTNNPMNLHVKDGSLTLAATQQAEPLGYKYASARIDTQNKQSFLYGRIDITAKIPTGAGLWPAVWLLPANNKYENLSPATDSTRYLNGGEMDLIEEVGYLPNTEYGIVHTLSDAVNPNDVGEYNTVIVPDGNESYNLYSLLWTPTTITYELNNIPFFTYNKTVGEGYQTWPFDQPFYLIINLALGGSWGGGDTAEFPVNGIDNSILPASMNIQSIYYYPYIGH